MNKKKVTIVSMLGFVLATSIFANAQENNQKSDNKAPKEEDVRLSYEAFKKDQDNLIKEQKQISFEVMIAEEMKRIDEEKRLAEEKKARELALVKEQERKAKVEQERKAKVEQERKAKAEQERLAKMEQERLAKKKAQQQVKSASVKSVKKTKSNTTSKNGSFFVEGIGMPYEHQAYLYEMTQKRGLDYLQTLAFIGVEITYRANAQGGSNYGYFQINKINHARLSQSLGTNNAPFDPYTNINWGTYMIADLHSKYGDWHSILSAYNKGEAGFRKTGHATDYVRKYDKILANLQAKK